MQDGDNSRDAGPHADKDEAALKERLTSLGASIASRKKKPDGPPSFGLGGDTPGMAKAMTLGTEFIGAILLGCAIGLGIDYLVGSGPLGLILFLLLGFAAGVLVVIRGAAKLSSPSEGKTGSDTRHNGDKAE